MKALIASVGGTPEPVVTALIEHAPDFVIFYSSQQSLDTLGNIKQRAAEMGRSYEDYKIVCDDVNDLVHCYERALQCTEKLRQRGVEPEQVIVDYTGGTKTMTAALTLATVGHGYSFSYVGGSERTKNGLGVVITGTEVVRTGVSPWQIFAVEEKKRIALFIASYQYEAAITTMCETLDCLSPREREIWSGILATLEGYRAWDDFDHRKAIRSLRSGLDNLVRCSPFCSHRSFTEYVEGVRANFETLKHMNEATDSFRKLHSVLVTDLLSNARRRYRQHKYDDAVARLYRALEMVGQVAFEQRTGCSTSRVDEEKIPALLREEYTARYGYKEAGKLKLGLFATFNVLAEMGDSAGLAFRNNERELRKLLDARNLSILAHGKNPVERETYESLESFMVKLFQIGDFIEFPQLNW